MKLRSSHALLIGASLSVRAALPAFAATPPGDTTRSPSKVEMIPSLPTAAPLPPPSTQPPKPVPPPAAPAAPPVASPGQPAAPSPAFSEGVPAWDYKSLAEWRRLPASDPLTSVAIAPNGKLIVGGGDGKVFFWNFQGDLLNTIVTEPTALTAPEPPKDKDDLLGLKPPPAPAQKNPVRLLIFSPDGRVLATSSDSTVRLWNAETGALLHTLAGHQGSVLALAFTPDSRALATGGQDKNVKLWNAATGQLLGTLSQHVYAVRALAFTQDMKALLSVGVQGEGRKNGELKMWDVAGKGDLLLETTLDRVSREAVELAAQGRILAAGADASVPTVALWDAQTGKYVRSTDRPFAIGNSVRSLAFTPDFRVVAGGGETNKKHSQVWLWEVKTGKMLRGIKTVPQNALAFSPDGRVLAVAGEDKAVQLWRVP